MTGPLRPFHAGGVPIIGAPQIREFRLVVLITCACKAKAPLLIDGLGHPSACPVCGRLFAVATIAGDVRQGPHIQINVADVRPSDASAPTPNGKAQRTDHKPT